MIGQVFTYFINVVGLLLSKLADFEIVTNVNLLNTLIVWNLIILVISLLNKLSKGSGNPKGADEVKIRVDPKTGVVVKGTQKDLQNAQAKYYKDMLG